MAVEVVCEEMDVGVINVIVLTLAGKQLMLAIS